MKKLHEINEKVIINCHNGMSFTDALEKARMYDAEPREALTELNEIANNIRNNSYLIIPDNILQDTKLAKEEVKYESV